MDEVEAGTKKLHELVKGLDPDVQVVVPVRPTNSLFLISLTKGANRRFVTVSEDDLIDLPNESEIQSKVTQMIKEALAGL
jgi:hypothetical protein